MGMAIPLLEGCNIAGKDITGDALLTQRALARYIVERLAHYHFTVKGNQPTLERDIALLFETRGAADFVEVMPPEHGRIETRRIWCSTALNAYLDFPHVGQVFLIERGSIDKRTGVHRREIALGITSRTPQQASPQRVLAVNRGHWSIESVHYIIDWNYDEDRSCIRTGHGPENITRVRRFAVGILKSFQKPAQSTQACAPQAAILFDKFRIMSHLSDALDDVRKAGFARLSGKDRPYIKGHTYTLLSNRENLTLNDRHALKQLLAANKRLNTAYVLKESFGQLWSYEREGWARRFFDNWRASLKWQRLKPYEKFAEMIERHWEGIATYCHPENKVSLGFVEGLNNKIRVIQRRAYGLCDEEYLRLKVLTCMLPQL